MPFMRLVLVVLAIVMSTLPVLAQIPGLQPAPSASAETESEDASADDPLSLLLDVLRDDAARERLITELEAARPVSDAAPVTVGRPGDAPVDQPVTIGGQIAVFTQDVTQAAARSLRDLAAQLRTIPRLFAALGRANVADMAALLIDLAVLVLATYGAFFILSFLTDRFRRLLKQRASRSTVGAALLAVVALLITNLLIVGAAWAAGQVLAVAMLSNTGRAAFHHALFLNAFVFAEGSQALVRAALSPHRTRLRFLPVSDADARMLTRWFRWTLSLLAFGQLLLVPVFNRFVSFNAGLAISVIFYVLVLAMVVNLVLRVRHSVSEWLVHLTAHDPGGVLHAIARYWHAPVLAYLFVLFAVVIIWPGPVLLDMLAATGKIILAIVLGIMVSTVLSRLILSGVKLPDTVNTRIPLLERRLNSFIPRALTLLRLLVFVVVAAVTLDAIGLFSIGAWLESEFGSRVAGSAITVAIILTVAFGAWLAVSSWVEYRLQPRGRRTAKARERTLLTLMRNAVTIAIVVFTAMFTLSEIGLDIAPLLASAGVIGLAIGFGAQKLVQDIITGIFIQLEAAMDVGDVVTIGGVSGTVERLTIRSAGLRDASGVYHVIPFSSVTTVSNFMRGYAYAVVDLILPVAEPLARVRDAMILAHARLREDESIRPDLVEPDFEFVGIERYVDWNQMVVRSRVKTPPGRQWAVTRRFTGLAKTALEELRAAAEAQDEPLPPAGEGAGDADEVLAEAKAEEARRLSSRDKQPRKPEVPDSPG